MAEVRFFGIRHHGPGCARSLVRAFAAWQPDAVLVEGPPEADGLLPHLNDAALVPPVALLVHAVETPQQAVFYPFARFSPEWQALRWDLEELRVSLFAQELGSRGGVSPKKLAQRLAALT